MQARPDNRTIKLHNITCTNPAENHTNYYHIVFNYTLVGMIEAPVVAAWCMDTFGDGPGPFYIVSERDPSVLYRWVNDLFWGEIHFRDEADAILFIMRWS